MDTKVGIDKKLLNDLEVGTTIVEVEIAFYKILKISIEPSTSCYRAYGWS